MSKASVLVVDDDVQVCRILHRMLSGQQYQVKMVPSVADAVAAWAGGKEQEDDLTVVVAKVR